MSPLVIYSEAIISTASKFLYKLN